MYKCKKCDFEADSVSAIGNHSKWEHNRDKQYTKCSHCNEKFQLGTVKKHELGCMFNPTNYTECKECGCHIRKELKFCNSSCSAKYNNRVGKTGYKRMINENNGIHPNVNPDKEPSYRKICFEKYEPKCIICGWDKSVDVHHIDNDHNNDNVKNLVPLCQNHHQLTRMNEYKDDINKQIKACVC